MKTNIYIDGANLYESSKRLGFNINYKKFIGWLRQKYTPNNIYIFIGYIPKHNILYKNLKSYGHTLIFKETIKDKGGKIKGNCDSELVLQLCIDFYENNFIDFVLISGDGDFSCLVKFLIEKHSRIKILTPNENKCSVLLKRATSNILNLVNHYHKFVK
ncbi:MAG: uncharacterized LabA/DUF88 family protein [Candidatus Paceibacteria bacterium]|jgi:uncharacterized LabA/DUF88 family protein